MQASQVLRRSLLTSVHIAHVQPPLALDAIVSDL